MIMNDGNWDSWDFVGDSWDFGVGCWGCPSLLPVHPWVPAFAGMMGVHDPFFFGRVFMSTGGWFLPPWGGASPCPLLKEGVREASSPCAFSGAQGWHHLLVSCYVAIGCDLGGRVMGPNILPWSLSLGLCTSTSAPSLSIASSVRRGRPRRGVRCCAERCARPLASISRRGTRRQTACLVDGAVLGGTVRSTPPSFDSPSRDPLAL